MWLLGYGSYFRPLFLIMFFRSLLLFSSLLLAVLWQPVDSLDLFSKPQAVFRKIQRQLTDGVWGKAAGETWSLCENPDSHLLRASRVEIVPSQPVIGQDISVTLNAEAMQQIPGGKINVQLRLGLIKFNKQFDLCQALTDISETRCPIKQGPITIKATQNIPKELPPFPVKGTIRVLDDNGALVTCVELDLKLVRP